MISKRMKKQFIKLSRLVFFLIIGLVFFGLVDYQNGKIFVKDSKKMAEIKQVPVLMPNGASENFSPEIQETESKISNEMIPLEKSLRIDQSKAKEAIQQIMSAHPELDFGISFLNLQTGEQIDITGEKLFVAASTIKVLVATYFLDRVQKGVLTLDTPLGDKNTAYHLEKMIKQSDNNSWYLFNDLLTWGALRNYAKKIGLNYKSEINSISAHDMTILLAKLYKGELLNEQYTKLLLSLMYKTHDERYIPGSQIGGMTYYHKTGKLDGFVHDASIIDDGTNKYVLTIFTNGKTDWTSRINAFHEITRAAFDTTDE
jgi:beta-lactamase class A